MNYGQEQSIVEALIMASPEPIASRKIAEVIERLSPGKVGKAVAELNNRYMETQTCFRIRELAGGYQFYIIPEYSGYVQELFTRRRKMRLTRAALETLAIVAYRQPVTKTEIEHIRGVASDGVIHNLLSKKMILIKGRAKTVGRALQYCTTDEFLKFFGLGSLEDLPKMSEIEELIAGEDGRDQAQLDLGNLLEDQAEEAKLNVADGTFDPESGYQLDEEEVSPVSTGENKDEPTNLEPVSDQEEG